MNGLNALVKGHKVSDWIKKKKSKTHPDAGYKRLILDPKTPLDLKWGGGKLFIITDIKKELE